MRSDGQLVATGGSEIGLGMPFASEHSRQPLFAVARAIFQNVSTAYHPNGQA
jgi:hypothetical protein